MMRLLPSPGMASLPRIISPMRNNIKDSASRLTKSSWIWKSNGVISSSPFLPVAQVEIKRHLVFLALLANRVVVALLHQLILTRLQIIAQRNSAVSHASAQTRFSVMPDECEHRTNGAQLFQRVMLIHLPRLRRWNFQAIHRIGIALRYRRQHRIPVRSSGLDFKWGRLRVF